VKTKSSGSWHFPKDAAQCREDPALPARNPAAHAAVPAGFERIFDELADLAAAGPTDLEQRRADLGAGYGLSFVPDWIPGLMSKHGLKMLGE